MLAELLKDNGSDLIAAITQGSNLNTSQAESLLPPALDQITDSVKAGDSGFDLGSLLGGGEGAASSLLAGLDIGKIASAAGLDEAQVQAGLASLIPTVLSLLGDKAGGAQGLLSMLGGGDSDGGSAGGLGALGSMAGKLFK